MTTTAGGRNRGRSGPGRLAWVALGGAALMVLGLTFALGMLVGRQWARQTPTPVAAESARRTPATVRRAGLAETSADRAVEPQEKLTFYKTLTAPLGSVSLAGKPELAPRPEPANKPRAAGAPVPADRAPAPTVRTEGTALPARSPVGAPVEDRLVRGDGERPAASADWAVQVGVFKNAQQAERVKRSLTTGGFPARVTPVRGDDGEVAYRVRVGAFKTKDEAAKTAERVRADRSLPTYVTAN